MIKIQELIQRLERIQAEHGPDALVEARNEAGDFDYVEHVGIRLGGNGVSVVSIETSQPFEQDYDRGDGHFVSVDT